MPQERDPEVIKLVIMSVTDLVLDWIGVVRASPFKALLKVVLWA
jgi:hypothetical protein